MRSYYLGLDMGTSSVGWAVTDKEYRLLRAKGKDMWGIREFEEAKTADERRTHRISRRRRTRQLIRIGLLKDYFHDAIAEVDSNFYIRLENSKYHREDKDEILEGVNGIFNDKNYKDKDYYEKYPTIFHLRKELIHNEEPHDVRLVYLALLNMFKHRGHFLIEGDVNTDGNVMDIYNEFLVLAQNEFEGNLKFSSDINIGKLEEILSNGESSRTTKSENIIKLLGIEKKDKKEVLLIKMLCGLNVDIKAIYEDIESENKLQICFSDAGYDDKIADIEDKLSDKQMEIIQLLKRIYDKESLDKILKGENYLSDARVKDYIKHKNDLKILKRLYKEYLSAEEYDKMFRSDKDGTYSAYVNSVNAYTKHRRNMKGRKLDEFYKNVKSDLKKIINAGVKDDRITCILKDIEMATFMPKQLTFENGVIPNSVHKKEMKAILKNAEKYLPFLLETDENGLTVSERIIQLFSFHIPYYIGPLTEKSQKDNGNGWVVRKEDGQVLPWNIEQKIDFGETSKLFVERMVRRCTYISGEQVLPKSSLLYEKYAVLNEINNLRIDGERITPEIKQEIYNELYLEGKRVTKTKLEKFLINRGYMEDATQLSGIDINLNNYLGSYGKFLPIFQEKLKEDKYIAIVEDIIYLSTIYGDSKKMLRSQLESKYGDVLDNKMIKRLLGIKFRDWGRISRKFLELEGCDRETGEATSIIKTMWDKNLNFMEIIHSSEFDFKERMEELQKNTMKPLSELQAEDLDDMYFSAPVKRMIWQTFKVIKEIEKILGCPPEKVFIEMSRTNNEKNKGKRTSTRKKQLLELYKNVDSEITRWKDIIENADVSGTLNSKKMYLYLKQMGKCMYTGRDIDLDELFDDNKYDIDHIYPRHYVKDDNLENNLVLVEKQLNSRKSDTYPIDEKIRCNPKVVELWRSLRYKKFISEEKYKRLTGRNEFTDEQKAGFIARQMVETSQGTKGVADIIKQTLPEVTIVYAKASNVSEFRKQYNLLKSRTVNDFHHAHACRS